MNSFDEKYIGFWGYPAPDIVASVKSEFKSEKLKWLDLDIDLGYPDTKLLPDNYCKIIKNIVNNALFLKGKLVKIIAPIGKDKCDSGWFVAKILKDLGFDVVESVYENLLNRKPTPISTSNLPLFDKVSLITAAIIEPVEIVCQQSDARFGFWGVPPNDLEILKLFPNETHLYGWTRCVEAGVPADIELEMFVEENVPTVFYAQAFCSKTQLAKYLADKYNGLFIDVDDYPTKSIMAKIEAFLRLR